MEMRAVGSCTLHFLITKRYCGSRKLVYVKNPVFLSAVHYKQLYDFSTVSNAELQTDYNKQSHHLCNSFPIEVVACKS